MLVRDLPYPGHDSAVVDGVLDRVASCRQLVLEVELDIDEEPLAVATLVVEDAVEAVRGRSRGARSSPDAPPLDGGSKGQSLDMRCDVVGAEQRRASIERRNGGADGGSGAADAAGRIAEDARQRALSGEPDENRARRCCRSARGHEAARGSGPVSCRSRSPGRGRPAPPGFPRQRLPRGVPRGTRPPHRRHRRIAARPASCEARPACA